MKDSETLYESIKSNFRVALDSTAEQLQLTAQYLEQFGTVTKGITNDTLKQEALNISSSINSAYITAYKALNESRQVPTCIITIQIAKACILLYSGFSGHIRCNTTLKIGQLPFVSVEGRPTIYT